MAKDTSLHEIDQNMQRNVARNDIKRNLNQYHFMTVGVPAPDFCNFDIARSEKCFAENQVGAVYDSDDGMPRHYAMVHNVVSLDPFAIRISWLKYSDSSSPLRPLSSISSGFLRKTCGEFRVSGKQEIIKSLDFFSHQVWWTKGLRGFMCIYPQNGDVWALYRNWGPEWNELTPDEVIHKYDMVEVIENYDEDRGVLVIPLVKVAGFRAVFHRHLDHRQARRITKEEMFRFSHYVPSRLLRGREGPNAPKGCRQLDPAATPVELLWW